MERTVTLALLAMAAANMHASGFMIPTGRTALVAFVPASRPIHAHSSHKMLNFECTSMLSVDAIGTERGIGNVISGIFGSVVLVAVIAFVYANVVYTPQIVEGAESIRMEDREVEIRKLLSKVQQHKEDGLEMDELIAPLEASFGMSVDEYVKIVNEKSVSQWSTDADRELADVLRSAYEMKDEKN